MVSDFMFIVIGYATTFMLGIVGIAAFMRGFLLTFFRVKASRGKKILVRVLNPLDDYYVSGKEEEGMLRFKDRTKETRIVPLDPKTIYTFLGCKALDIDDVKNLVIDRRKMEFMNGYDAKQYDALYTRILMRPSQTNVILTIILVLVIAVTLVALADGFIDFKTYEAVTKLGQVATNTITPGG